MPRKNLYSSYQLPPILLALLDSSVFIAKNSNCFVFPSFSACSTVLRNHTRRNYCWHCISFALDGAQCTPFRRNTTSFQRIWATLLTFAVHDPLLIALLLCFRFVQYPSFFKNQPFLPLVRCLKLTKLLISAQWNLFNTIYLYSNYEQRSPCFASCRKRSTNSTWYACCCPSNTFTMSSDYVKDHTCRNAQHILLINHVIRCLVYSGNWFL